MNLPWWIGSGTRFYDRHQQLETLFLNTDLLGQLTPEQYWNIVGEVWKRTEFPHHQCEAWYCIFSETPGLNTYTKKWLETPQVVYRGINSAYQTIDCDWSWTTDRDRAEWFSRRFDCEQPLILEFDTSKDPHRVWCVFEDDPENEVLLWSPRAYELAQGDDCEIVEAQE